MDLLLMYRKVYVSSLDSMMKRKVLSSRNSISLKMISFCKSEKCPTSQDLLEFQKGEALEVDSEYIFKHLEQCEFCAAEIELYSHFPQYTESVSRAEIPLPLYQLAEALLSNGQKKFLLLNKLLNDNESFTLKKA